MAPSAEGTKTFVTKGKNAEASHVSPTVPLSIFGIKNKGACMRNCNHIHMSRTKASIGKGNSLEEPGAFAADKLTSLVRI